MRSNRFGSGGPGKNAHQKSMGSYESHAYNDAVSIAYLLHAEVGAEKARQIYERIARPKLLAYEDAVAEHIAEFIQKTESQRPSFVRKRLSDETNRVAFLTLSILGCLRAREVMELRDSFRESLVPGHGNRVTTASLYLFAEQVRKVFDYEWPSDAFSDITGCIDDDFDGNDDEDADSTSNLQ